MRIKFTTYDARRDEDIIHLDTDQSNVMLLNPGYTHGGTSHPFRYGKVIAILHADVGFVGEVGRLQGEYFYRRMDVLWVRWYSVCPWDAPESDQPEGVNFDKVKLIPIDDPGSHGFIDPEDVLHACHMVPDFKAGPRYPGGIGKSPAANDGNDYDKYFVNRYVIYPSA
jgi:hypothetical protein